MKAEPRIIPILQLKGSALVKTYKFADETYLGDPLNAVRIFNDKEVDELVLLDIGASVNRTRPQIDFLRSIAGECFMPLAYGGGVDSIESVAVLLNIGFERVIVNSAAWTNPGLITELVDRFGTSTVIAAVDVKLGRRGSYKAMIHGGSKEIPISPIDWAKKLAQMGVGELLLTSIDRDGTMEGYDVELIKEFAGALEVPLIAAGGAGHVSDLYIAADSGGASGVAAGSLFVFHGRHRAVLINYPSISERREMRAP